MTKKEQEARLRKLLEKQAKLKKELKNHLGGDYYYFKGIADELEAIEEELWDSKVFGVEDISTSLEDIPDDARNCERIYYLFGFLKEDEEERSENYFERFDLYLMYVPPFYPHKEYAFYYNLIGGSKLVCIEDREKFEGENYIIIGKRPTITYKNLGEYNHLMQTHQAGYNEIQEDFYKYQRVFDKFSKQLGQHDAAKQTYLKCGKKRILSKRK